MKFDPFVKKNKNLEKRIQKRVAEKDEWTPYSLNLNIQRIFFIISISFPL